MHKLRLGASRHHSGRATHFAAIDGQDMTREEPRLIRTQELKGVSAVADIADPVVTIDPERWDFIADATATHVATVATTFRRRISSSSPGSIIDANTEGPTPTPGSPTDPPALQTAMSMRPQRSVIAFARARWA